MAVKTHNALASTFRRSSYDVADDADADADDDDVSLAKLN